MQRIRFDRHRARKLRLQRAWSLAELADKAGVPATSLSRWETGKRNPSTATIRKLAIALQVDAAELIVLDTTGNRS
jgi:transcriptional regulator with XRE-family HTH domain